MKAQAIRSTVVSDGIVVLEGLKEISMLAVLFANVSYGDLVDADPEVLKAFTLEEYERVMGDVLNSAIDMSMIDPTTLGLNAPIQLN